MNGFITKTAAALSVFTLGCTVFCAELPGTLPSAVQNPEALLSSCNSGDGNACWILGTRYQQGVDTTKDLWQAAAFFKQACELGVSTGCGGLGTVTLEDPQYGDGQSAVYWLDKACDLADVGACALLAQMYQQGVQVQPSDDLAHDYTFKTMRFARRKCILGEAYPCALLGEIYQKSPYVRHDEIKSRGFHQRGCLNLSSRCCAILATDYNPQYDEIKSEGDLQKAITYYTERCKLGFPHACISLSLSYSNPSLSRVKPDYVRSLQSMNMACDLGEPLGCLALGTMYAQGEHVKADVQKALENYERSCELGEGMGCGRVGFYYLNGIGVEADEKQGSEFARRGCDSNDAHACLILGNYLLKNKGQEGREDAINLFETGCLNDDGDCCNALGDLYMQENDTRSLREAERLYELSCTLEDGYGCMRLVRYRQEHGQQRFNEHELEEMYQRACDFGDPEGCDKLREIYGGPGS